MNRLLIKSLAMVAITVCVVAASGCSRKKFLTDEGIVWNTSYHIIYDSPKSLTDSILCVFSETDASLSVFNEKSTVTRVNENVTDSIDTHFARVYTISRQINEESGGMFDPTLSPVITAWGFGKGHSATADTLRIDSLLAFTGIDKTGLEGMKLYKSDPRIAFNFSAIAKGYGVDCVAEMLERNGVKNYLVEIGGEIRTKGLNREGKQWVIAVDTPMESSDVEDRTAILTLTVTDIGIATSGNYRNFHSNGGNTYGHTISPVTGRPIQTDVISATVLAPTSMEADALATACMALGSKEAMNMCNHLDRGVLLILSDLSILTNSMFDRYVAH